MGRLMSAQTIGIIGYGNIGKKVAKLARAFAARVLIHDMQEVDSPGEGIIFCELNELLEKSDIITLHVPGTQENLNFIDEHQFGRMKENAILVNTARGGLINEKALNAAVRKKNITAALDTFAHEPYMGELTQMENVILTAHMGSYALESRLQQENDSVENLFNEMQKQGYIS